MSLAVEIEKIDSWPEDFREEAEKNRSLLVNYHQEYFRISQLCDECVKYRVNPPQNIYATEYSTLVTRLEKILSEHDIVGYHCTRLTPREINDIRADGLKILTGDLVNKKLENALEDGHISEIEFTDLKSSEIIKKNLENENGRRTGLIAFCPNRSILKNFHGVYRLFRYWGGEAVYRGYEKIDKFSLAKRFIGLPCVIKCAVPYSDMKNYSSVAESFLSHLILDEIESPETPAKFNMGVERDIAPVEILDLIDISNPEFEELTNYTNWRINGNQLRLI